jgi:hypothetical protein
MGARTVTKTVSSDKELSPGTFFPLFDASTFTDKMLRDGRGTFQPSTSFH